MRIAFAFVLLTAGCATSTLPPAASPIVAYPMSGRIMNNGEVVDGFADLVRLAGYCKRADERAGFLVLDENGHFKLVKWPASNSYHAQAWSGAIPDGTVAVAHTHPAALPDASPHDRDEARRLGMPIFVLTPDSVVLIGATDGRPEAIAGRGWLRP